MRKIIWIILLGWPLSFMAQSNCKKLTGKTTGSRGNKCCKTQAALADQVLLDCQAEHKDAVKKHAPFGLPNVNGTSVKILYAPNFICGYDTIKNIPVWVQYKMLCKDEWTDGFSRINCFRPDIRMSMDQRITHADYTHSGFDRGHLLPANDAKSDSISHLNTFVMTNMAPQYSVVNQREWLTLESYLGSISRSDSVNEAYMITGCIVDSNYQTIGEGRIAVPTSFYKIFFFRMEKKWEYWTFHVLNDKILQDIRIFEVELIKNHKSIDELEALTGTDFKVTKKKVKKTESSKGHDYIQGGMFYKGYGSTY